MRKRGDEEMGRQAERKLIGSILINENTLGKCGRLKPEMFSDSTLSHIFRKAMEMSEADRAVNAQSLITECADRIDKADSQLILRACVTETDSAVFAADYVEDIIRDYKASRITAFVKARSESGINSGNILSIQKELENLTDELREDREDSKASPEDLVKELKPKRFVLRDEKFIHLGFGEIDADVGGLAKGDVCVIAARPGVGKSAFALQAASNLCKKGLKVKYFNEEMTKEQLYDRFIAHLSGIELNRIRNATLFRSGEEKEAFERANERFSGFPLEIISGVTNINDIRYSCKDGNCDVVIIDYIQLVTSGRNFRNRYEEVGMISKAVKNIAMSRQIPVIVLSQLNRTSSDTKEPSMSELRESGDIEQDASVIIMLWNRDDKKRLKGVKVEKNRQGKTGSGTIIFDGACMRFGNGQADEFEEAEPGNPFV